MAFPTARVVVPTHNMNGTSVFKLIKIVKKSSKYTQMGSVRGGDWVTGLWAFPHTSRPHRPGLGVHTILRGPGARSGTGAEVCALKPATVYPSRFAV